MNEPARFALAGAVAATAWALLEPVDRRVFRHDYSDVAVLGKLVTRGPAWRPVGFALHATNGALFGLAYRKRNADAAGRLSGWRCSSTSPSIRSRRSSIGTTRRTAPQGFPRC